MKLGEILVSRGLVTPEQVEDALFAQRQYGGRLGTNLIELGFITDEDLAQALSAQLGVPYVKSQTLAAIPKDVIARLPKKLAEKYRAVPLRFQGGDLHICMADPQNLAQLDALGFALTCRLHPYVVTEVTLNYALERYYGIRREVRMTDVAGGLRELHTPAPSPAYREAPLASPPVFNDISEAPASVLEDLARVMAEDDVSRTVFRYFTEVFDEVMILAVGDRRPVLVRAGNRNNGREVPGGVAVGVTDGSLLQGVLLKPQALHQPVLTDPDMKRLCSAIGFPSSNVSLIPIFDGNRPYYLVIGQGRDERYLMSAFRGIKSFVAKASHALRIVALRREIRAA